MSIEKPYYEDSYQPSLFSPDELFAILSDDAKERIKNGETIEEIVLEKEVSENEVKEDLEDVVDERQGRLFE